MTKIVRDDLQQAKSRVDDLVRELGSLERLVSDDERAARVLKKKGAPLEEQTEVRKNLAAHRELLAEHRSDLTAAHETLRKIEALVTREAVLEVMADEADRATDAYARFNREYARLNEELPTLLEPFLQAYSDMASARSGFFDKGAKLARGLVYLRGNLNVSSEAEAAAHAVLDELTHSGVDISEVLTHRYQFRSSVLSTMDHDSEVPSPFGELIFKTMMQLQSHRYELARREEASRVQKEVPPAPSSEETPQLVSGLGLQEEANIAARAQIKRG